MSDEANEVTQALEPCAAGWIVSNSPGTKWRTWEGGMPDWTDDREKATRYARRIDAEHVHTEDEDSWRIEPYVIDPRTAASQASAGEWVQKPRPYPHAQRGDGLKYQETLGFEGGSITIRTTNNGDKDGTGWFCFGEDGQRLEYDEEWGNYFHIVDVPNSELIAIRDKLNEIFPLTTPVEASQPVGDAGEGLAAIAAERTRQIEVEGWSTEHDDEHADCQMAGAAACYAMSAIPHWAKHEAIRLLWPWSKDWWKPRSHRENLVRAGALIVAEIDRIDRAALNEGAA